MALETEYANFATVEEQIAAEVIPAMTANVVASPFVMREMVKEGSSIAEFRKLGSVTASSPGQGTAPTKQEYEESKVQITVAESTVWTEVTAFAKMLVNSSQVNEIIDASARALALARDTSILNLAASVTNTAGTTATALNRDAILDGIFLLNDGNALGERYGVISAQGALDIHKDLNADAATGFNTLAQRGFENGQYNASSYVGSFMGIPFFQSSNVYSNGGDDFGMIFTRYAFGIAEGNGGEIMLLEGVNPSTRILGQSLTLVYGSGIVSQACAVRLRHAA